MQSHPFFVLVEGEISFEKESQHDKIELTYHLLFVMILT